MTTMINLSANIGYYLMRRRVTLRNSTRAYRGVDRMPDTPWPLDIPNVGPSGLLGWRQLWEDYWAADDSGHLHADLSQCIHLQRRFLDAGLDMEVICVRIAGVPDDGQLAKRREWRSQLTDSMQRCTEVASQLPEVPFGSCSLGFDIAWPGPSFHSAIYQPGLETDLPELYEELNESGLLDCAANGARRFDQAFAMLHGGIPFCLLEVISVPFR